MRSQTKPIVQRSGLLAVVHTDGKWSIVAWDVTPEKLRYYKDEARARRCVIGRYPEERSSDIKTGYLDLSLIVPFADWEFED